MVCACTGRQSIKNKNAVFYHHPSYHLAAGGQYLLPCTLPLCTCAPLYSVIGIRYSVLCHSVWYAGPLYFPSTRGACTGTASPCRSKHRYPLSCCGLKSAHLHVAGETSTDTFSDFPILSTRATPSCLHPNIYIPTLYFCSCAAALSDIMAGRFVRASKYRMSTSIYL